jgi:hypothetical protein
LLLSFFLFFLIFLFFLFFLFFLSFLSALARWRFVVQKNLSSSVIEVLLLRRGPCCFCRRTEYRLGIMESEDAKVPTLLTPEQEVRV